MLRIVKTCLLATLLATAMAGIARAEIVTRNCGVPILSKVVTGNDLFETTSRTFTRLRGAVVTVTVPAGQTLCVKVRFTAGVTCKGSSGNEACFIRALADNSEMNPQPSGNQALGGRLERPIGLGYQWLRFLNEGQHVIQIQMRALDAPEIITVGVNDWMMDVEVLN
jgi:hypothetical protein